MKKTLLIVAVALAMAFGVTACGGSGSKSGGTSTTGNTSKAETAKTVPAIVGAWECVGIDLDGSGEFMDAAQYKELTQTDIKSYMSIQAWENGQALLTMGSTDTAEAAEEAVQGILQWTESNGAFDLTASESSGEKYHAEIGDDKQMKLEITATYLSTEDGKTSTITNKMAVLLKRTGDPDMTSIYSLNFNYTDAQTQTMSALMQGGYYVMDGNTAYGFYYGDKLAKVEVKKDGSSPKKVSESILKENLSPCMLTKKGDTLYYSAQNGKKASGIYSMDVNSGKETELVKGEVDYLNVTDKYLFYTDSTSRIYRADLDGKNATKVCDDEAYYVYALSDNFLLYQDDANSEMLVIYNIATKEKFQVAPAYSYNPVIANGYLYYVTKINDAKYLCRTNLTTGVMETGDFNLTYSVFFISNGKIYFDDGFSVTIDKWNKLTGNIPVAYGSISFEWVDDTYCIEEGISTSNLYCVEGDDGYVAMMTNEDWAKIS